MNISSSRINFIFFGRLEKEKGIDYIYNFWKLYQGNQDLNGKFTINLFGSGSRAIKIQELEKEKTNNLIKCWGRQDRSIINKYLQESTYTLMPSRFLETFGLVALESYTYGIPVIGFGKGGLEKLILPEYDINTSIGDTLQDKFNCLLIKLIHNFEINNWHKNSLICQEISKKYTVQKWIENFNNIIPIIGAKKKILCISDYKIKLYGIESYIYDLSEIFTPLNIKIEILGFPGINGNLNKYLKLFLLPFTGFNFWYYWKLRQQIRIFKPDIIRLHSVSRFLGWLVVFGLKHFKGEKIIMYHDLGYFHPFPSQVENIEQIPNKFNFKVFLNAANTYNPIKIFIIFLKFLSSSLIRKYLKQNIDIHLVPSDFMVKILENNYQIPISQIKVLPHFKK